MIDANDAVLESINNQTSFIENTKTNTQTQTLPQKKIKVRVHEVALPTSFQYKSAKGRAVASGRERDNCLEEDLADGMDNTVGDLDVLLLELDSVHGGASSVDLEGLSSNSGDITTEGRGGNLAGNDVASEDLSKVGDVLELKLGDSELLGGSTECIIIRSEDSELGIGVHEGLVEASLADKRAKDHVVGVLGDSAVDGPIRR